MSNYVAPVKDMLFAMNELAGLQEIVGLPGNEEVSTDLVEAILEEAGKFATEVVDPLNRVGDKQGNKWNNGVVTTADGFKEAYASFCETGWNGMPASTEFGGQGLPVTVSTAVLEMWKSASISFSLCQMLTLGAVEAIAHHGSEELKATYLPNMVSGKWTGTMNLTEPQAGSDLAAIRTKAEPRADGSYAITGTKIFITWGEHDMAENIVHLVLARLPDAPPGVKGISLFIAPKFLVNADGSLGERNDLICASIEHKMGIHGSATAVMSFGDKGGAIGYLVGEPNRGLEYMFTMMNHARLNVGLEGVGVSERSYQHALAYARERIQGKIIGDKSGEKKPILHHPDVRRMLMDMKSRTEAGRALAYYVAGSMDRAKSHPDADVRAANQRRLELLTPVVKGWCTENAQGITWNGVQVHGGMGFIEETGAAQYMRDARIITIYEGTTAIQANDLIGRKILRENGETLRELIAELRDGTVTLRGNDFASLADGLDAAVAALEDTTDWILANGKTRLADVLAGAVPFLHLLGSVVGAWQMGRMAQAARLQLAAGEGDAVYLRSLVELAHFYFATVLPEAAARAQTVQMAGPALSAFSEAAF